MKFLAILLVLLSFSVTSCKKKAASVVSAPLINEITVADAKAVDAFVHALVEAGRNGDQANLKKSFDQDLFAEEVFAGLELSVKDLREYKVGLIKGMNSNPKGILMTILSQEGIEYLHQTEIDGKVLPIMRVANDAGINYVFLKLHKKADRLVVVDFFVMMTGEWTSESSRRLIIPIIAATKPSLFKKKKDREFVANLDSVTSFTKAIRDDDFASAISEYKKLPETLAKQRFFWSLYLSALAKVDDEKAYSKEIRKFEKAFPNDLGVVFVTLDGAFMDKDWDLVLEKLDKIDDFVGGDPYLDLYRCNTELGRGNNKKALAYCEKLIAWNEGFEDAYWTKIAIYSGEKDFAGMRENLEILRDQFGLEADAEVMRVDETYAEFMKSEEAAKFSSRSKNDA